MSTTSQAVKNPGEKTYELAASGIGMTTEMMRTMIVDAQNAVRTSAKLTRWIDGASLSVGDTVESLIGVFLSSYARTVLAACSASCAP